MIIGVLALQGAFREHVSSLKALGMHTKLVRSCDDFIHIDALIIPGGESTTMMKLISKFKLASSLRNFIKGKNPVWGTCAGLILLSDRVDGNEPYFGGMPISSKRNAYGRQSGSFKVLGEFKSFDTLFPMVFIRAPEIIKCTEGVLPLAEINGSIVAARYEALMVTAFHPELTDDLRIHEYFINVICKKSS